MIGGAVHLIDNRARPIGNLPIVNILFWSRQIQLADFRLFIALPDIYVSFQGIFFLISFY